jgi:hypothetical protein
VLVVHDQEYATVHHYRIEANVESLLVYYDDDMKNIKSFERFADIQVHHGADADGLVCPLTEIFTNTFVLSSVSSEPVSMAAWLYETWPQSFPAVDVKCPIANISRASAVRLLRDDGWVEGSYILRFVSLLVLHVFVVIRACRAADRRLHRWTCCFSRLSAPRETY